MLKFLQNSGLSDIRFMIINSKQTGADFRSLSELVRGSEITVFQETSDEPIWSKLEGGKDDMFVYDRCGRLAYYVPYPLSAIHDNKPIVHTTILSSYFDNPCGPECPADASSPSPETELFSRTTFSPGSIVSSSTPSNDQSSESNATEVIILDEIDSEPPISSWNAGSNKSEEDLLTSNITQQVTDSGLILVSPSKAILVSQSVEGESGSGEDGSGSGIEPDTTMIISVTTSVPAPILESSDQFSIWKIWQFFFGEVQAAGDTESDRKSSSLDSVGNPLKSTASWIMEKRCNGFDKSVCVEISVGKLLRARLCCLKEGGQTGTRGFGCIGYTKSICSKMLPLIKCCLKDFDQLLDTYLNNTKSAYVG